jgi:glycosyltransferase involved in cell wall biosynthesis
VKIALVLPGGVDRSGTERVIPCLLWLIERLARTDEVHVFALHQEARRGSWQLLGATVHNIGTRPRRAGALAALMAEHRRQPFDVVHGFWAAGPGAVAALFGKFVGIPALVSLPGGDLAALPAIGYGARLHWTGRTWTRLALTLATRVIVPSDWIGARAVEFDVAPIRIPFGVALDRWPVAEPHRRNPATPLRLVHVANLNPVKDQGTLLATLSALKARGLAFHLDVIGMDTLGGRIQRQAAELGMAEMISFHGFMPHADTRPWVEAADLMLVTSVHEAGPMVALEAAVAGVPTIGTRVGHLADWARQIDCTVQIGDAVALAAMVMRYAEDVGARLDLAHFQQAQAVAENADITTARTRALYLELAARRP